MNNNKIFHYTLKQLILYGVHLGHNKKKRAPLINNFLLGHRNNIDIFNLNQTIITLNKIIPIITTTIQNNGKILIIAENAKFLPLINQFALNFKQPIYTSPWTLGILTNFKNLKNNNSQNTNINLLNRLPDLIIIVNSTHPNYILNEAKTLEIPTILFNDSNINPKNCTYSIPSNDDSLDTLNLYLNIIKKAISYGFASQILKFKS